MHHKFMTKKTALCTAAFCLALLLPITTVAENTYMEEMEARKELPIESDSYENWPEGPKIGAEAAILMEMTTHTILYAKNIDEKMYPASTTKILTSLIAAQNCSLDETVTFSTRAVYDVPRDASNMGMDAGEELTMEQALYGVLVASANEAASAVGEHVAQKLGYDATPEAFAALMNEKAASLGCKNSHFVNANGLFDENHYTSAYDLALIGCEFFQNEMLCQMSSTSSYHIPATARQPDDIWISSKNKLYKGKEYAYEYLLGSKTGYVDNARQTLVSAAEKDGIKLVCVVFKEESPYQFADTVTLFDYGFSNFRKLSIAEKETKYNIDNKDSFSTDHDLFGDSAPLISLDEEACVIIPRDASFSDLTSTISYESEVNDDNTIATIMYDYYGQTVGSCPVYYHNNTESFVFDSLENTPEPETTMDGENSSNTAHSQNVIFVNVKKVLFIVIGIGVFIWLISTLISLFNSYNFSTKGESKRRRRDRLKEKRAARKKQRAQVKARKRLLKQRKNAYKKRKKS
ncbi:MAG: D-alanyl-D-alanine carboxypeptidase [Lachnospiraceae bacterium]|nr:D-alanyl-D-alanine carboxypeptidase [Lachnospiraceae bacterium]